MDTQPEYLGKYILRERLASGGMGEVWKAFDPSLNRVVAIKLLRADRRDDEEFVSRFEREARLIASLRHPNIVQIHDFDVAYDAQTELALAYMVMDYVQGQTLKQYIHDTARKGRFPPPDDIVYLFAGAGRAIDYAHQQGIIHRDIKPDNILLDQRLPVPRSMGRPVLTDFGIARLLTSPARTAVGMVLGTPLYMAPEQAQGNYEEPRSDLYALGIILYEMMTGVTPFRGDTPFAIMLQHLQSLPTPPMLLNPAISPALSAIILKSIARAPEDRFASAAQMVAALAKALQVAVPEGIADRPFVVSSPPPPIAGVEYAALPGRVPTQVVPVTSQAHLGPVEAPPVAIPPTGKSRSTRGYHRRWRISAIVFVCLCLLALASSLVFHFLPGQHNTPTPAAIGTIHFAASTHAVPGNYDLLDIALSNIPDPPAGHVYYAWLESVGAESEQPHWKLVVQHGQVAMTSLSYPGYKTLLLAHSLFLITSENSSVPPDVPYPALSAHLYYASITTTTVTTFPVLPCPHDSSSTACIAS